MAESHAVLIGPMNPGRGGGLLEEALGEREDELMGVVAAAITMSVDGYVTGPGDGPGRGLGVGGERLHQWVFGGPWTYDARPDHGSPDDAGWMAEQMSRVGAVIAGRRTYEAGDRWGGRNPWPVPLFVLTHHLDDEPPDGEFTFVGDLPEAVERARAAAGEKDVHVMGGADTIRQVLAAGLVDELSIVIAPVVLGDGKRLFEGFTRSVELEQLGVRQSRLATFLDYRVVR